MQYQLLLDENAENRQDMILMIDGDIKKFVPNDPENADWQAYQAWLALDNEPEPAE